MDELRLKLYISGDSIRSRQAVENLKMVLGEMQAVQYELNVIDVMQEPAQAELDDVLATPTLIKNHPQPVRRIIGDLSNRASLLAGLDIQTSSIQVSQSGNEVQER